MRRTWPSCYKEQHGFYCGVDLHARTMYVCVIDNDGRTREHVNLPCDPGRFLKLIEPYRDQIVVSCECLFAWYWLADLCRESEIPFVLGHALYMKAIHGGKTKSDKSDSEKIARLLNGGNLPQAYVYPAEMRARRDLRRRRMKLVRLRGQAVAHVTNTFTQYNLAASPLRARLSSGSTEGGWNAVVPFRLRRHSHQQVCECEVTAKAEGDSVKRILRKKTDHARPGLQTRRIPCPMMEDQPRTAGGSQPEA